VSGARHRDKTATNDPQIGRAACELPARGAPPERTCPVPGTVTGVQQRTAASTLDVMRMRVVSALAALVAVTACIAPAAQPASPAEQLRMKQIVRLWSERLNAGDNAGVAKLFRLPATIIQATTYGFHTRKQLAEFHSLLPCSGHITSIVVKGRYATAVFELGDRGGAYARCESRGVLVAARFEIVGGKIVSWEQIPVPRDQNPMDNPKVL